MSYLAKLLAITDEAGIHTHVSIPTAFMSLTNTEVVDVDPFRNRISSFSHEGMQAEFVHQSFGAKF